MPQCERPKTLERAVRITLQNYGVAAIIAVICLLLLPGWLLWSLLFLVGVVFLSSIIAPYIDDWRPRARVPAQGKAVFISGCDTGFGNLLARRLDDLGLHVFAGCLFPEKDGAQSLQKECSSRLHIVPLDVTSDESVENAKKYVVDNIGDKKLWAVVNNAGLNAGAEMMWTTMDVMKRIFDVNTFGVMRLTKAFLPMLCKDKGRVVTVASAAGRYTYPGLVPYCMTKQATVSFCEGLRIEMYRFGIKVVTIEPWMYKTPIYDKDRILKYVQETWEDSPEEVKTLYPENYLDHFKRSVARTTKWNMSDKFEEVISCLEEAIMTLNPKYSYNPGKLVPRHLAWFTYRLPKPLIDTAIHDQYVNLMEGNEPLLKNILRSIANDVLSIKM